MKYKIGTFASNLNQASEGIPRGLPRGIFNYPAGSYLTAEADLGQDQVFLIAAF
jgi:hypothetical protein